MLVKIYPPKNEFVENVWPANSAFLLMFRHIAPKQFNSLPMMDTLSRLDGAEVMHLLWV